MVIKTSLEKTSFKSVRLFLNDSVDKRHIFLKWESLGAVKSGLHNICKNRHP